jgi:hypothetical protein
VNLGEANAVAGSINVYNNGAYMARYKITFNLYGQSITHKADNYPVKNSKTIGKTILF